MIFDKQNLFSEAQAITASAGSTNVIDLGAMGIPYGSKEAPVRDIGKGPETPLLVQVVEAFDNLTSLTIGVQTCDDPDFASGVIDHSVSIDIPLESLAAGYQMSPAILPFADIDGMGRYMRLYYTVTGTAPTAGAITAGIVAGIQSNG